MQYLNFSSADVNGRAYKLGQWLRENWPEISGFVSDPANLIFFAFALLLAALALGVAVRSTMRILRDGWDIVFPHAGEITLGHRREKPLDFILDPPVKLRFEDRRKGGAQIVGPTGQGKTTMMKQMILADAAQGHTVVVLETDGDLGPQLLPYTAPIGEGLSEESLRHHRGRRLVAPVHCSPRRRLILLRPRRSGFREVEPSRRRPPEIAVRQAVDTIASVSRSHEFYRDFNEDVMRHMTRLVCACARDLGAEPTVKALLNVLADTHNLEYILDLDTDGGRVSVNAPFVEGELKAWLEQEYFAWSDKTRREYLIGLRNLLRKLLSDEAVTENLVPREGDVTLDVDKALESGGVIIFRAPSDFLGHVGSQTLATWFLQRFQQETLGRKMPMRPVCFYLDEAHVVLGRRNTSAADSFASWFVQVRRFNVAPHVGYQSFSQLPDPLKKVLDSSARNKLISGGLFGDDAIHAQDLLGHATKPETEVRELGSETLFGPKRRQRVTRNVEGPRYSISEIENLPLGRWFFRSVKGGRQLPPSTMKVSEPPPANTVKPGFYCPHLIVTEDYMTGDSRS